MNKAPILIALLVIMVIIGFAYFRLVLSSTNTKPVYDAVTESALMIFEFKDFSKTAAKINKANYQKDIQQAGFISKIFNQLATIDQYLHINNFKPGNGNNILATMHITGAQDYNYLYIIQAEAIDRNQFKAMMIAVGEKLKVKERTFKEEKIYDVADKGGKFLFSVFKFSSLMLVSENASLTEEAILQLKEKKSILENEDFVKVKELTGGESDALLYLNFKKITALQPLILKDDKAHLIQNIAEFSEWMENDIMFEKEAIIINGYTLFNDAKKSWISQFAQKPADKLTLTENIPEQTALFMLVSNADNATYFESVKNNISAASNLKYVSYFKNFTADEWAFGMTEPLDTNWKNHVYLIIKHTDSINAVSSLSSLKNFIEKDTTGKIHTHGKLPIGNLLNEVYGKYLLPLNNPYYKVSQGFTVFANDTNTIQKIINDVANSQTLNKNVAYINFSKNINAASNLYLYINTVKLSELVNNSLSNVLIQNNNNNKIYQRFNPTSIQFNYEENLFFTNIYIQYKNSIENKTEELWKMQLDTVAATPAYIVKSNADNEKNIIVQDVTNQLYLINKAGKIIWKLPLQSKILSAIQTIDFYNNGKWQYIFNTEESIMIIDQEGKPVNNYPLSLPAKATTGMLLAHYPDVNQYRIFVPCEDRIYGYELSGKPLIGWNPKSKTGNVTQPMQHHIFNGKDYLVVLNNEGKLCLFDRKGENRTAPVSFSEPVKGILQSNITDKQFELVLASISGNVYKVNETGSIKTLKFTDNTNFQSFVYTDITNDSKPEYIFIEPQKIIAYNDSFTIAAELNLTDMIDAPVFSVSNNTLYKTGLLSKQTQKGFILQSDGTIFNQFTINTTMPFVLGNLNAELKNIIVTSNNNGQVIAYRLR